jgi:hypothetical protein
MGIVIGHGVSVEMSDGVRLAANIYRRDAEGPWPVLVPLVVSSGVYLLVALGVTVIFGLARLIDFVRGQPGPRLLLLQEQSPGLRPDIFVAIRAVPERLPRTLGSSVLLVEQNSKLTLAILSRAFALVSGQLMREGAVDKIRHGRILERAYLGDTR